MLTIPEPETEAAIGFELDQIPPTFGVSVTVPPTQTTEELIVDDGLGSTVIVKFVGEPGQPSNNGVTVIVELIGVELVLSVKKDTMFPEPLDEESPVVVFVFDQVYVVPGILLEKTTGSELTPAHFSWSEIGEIVGVGLI